MADLQIDYKQVEHFLQALGKNGETRARGISAWKDWAKNDALDEQVVTRWQLRGNNAYIVINDGGDNDKSITACRAAFCEWDDRPTDWQVTAWKELNLPEPSLQVFTGGKSIHNYWIFDQPIAVEPWRALQQRLIAHAKSDKSLDNPSRVMRLPGTWHLSCGKQKPQVVRDQQAQIIHDSGLRYSLDQLDQAVPQLPTPPRNTTPPTPVPAPPPPGSVDLPALLSRDQKELFRVGTQEGSRNDDCFRLACSLLAIQQECSLQGSASLGFAVNGSAAQWLDDFNNRCSPPLPEHELQSVLASAAQSNPEPDPGLPRRISYQQNELGLKRNPTTSPSTQQQEEEESPPQAILRLINELLDLRLTTSDTWAEEMAVISSLTRSYGVPRQDVERRILEALAERWQLSITQTHSGRRTNRSSVRSDDDESEQMLVDGFLPWKRDALIFGPGGAGKTTAAVAISWAVITGTPFLDHQIPSDITGKVLWIGSDGGDGAYGMWRNTAEDFGIADAPRWIDGCIFWGSEPDNDVGSWACTPAGLLELKSELETGGYALVVIDTWKAVLELAGIDFGIGPVGTVVRFLQALIGQHCSALYLHHPSGNSKGKGVAGAGGNQNINQIPYAVHQLTPQPVSDGQPPCVRWDVHKLRGYQRRDFLYRLTDDGLQVTEGDVITNCADALLITIADLEGLGSSTTSPRIKNMLNTIKDKTISNNLTRLRQRGLLCKTGSSWHLTRRGQIALQQLLSH